MKLVLLALFSALVLAGCVSPGGQSASPTPAFEQAPTSDIDKARTAKPGDLVMVDYVGQFENGTVFDTSIEAEAKKAGFEPPLQPYAPITFVLGSGQVIRGFDNAVVGMRVGEEKKVTLPPGEAYGERTDEAIMPVERSLFGPDSANLSVGDRFLSSQGPGVIVALNESHAMVDLNPPLAGKTLVFRLILRKIN